MQGNAQEHGQQREEELQKILSSTHPRRVIVAGPGTGKSHLFEKVIIEAKKTGKSKFLALTFIGKLGDALADDLAGLAETTTLHGFARSFVLDKCPKGWTYYPKIAEIIEEDLRFKAIKPFELGDANYEERTKHYKAIGDLDVVSYAVKVCKKDDKQIPVYDLILVDEFQDFNKVEAEFIDLLSTRSNVLIVGDDDQALYEFKGSSPLYIRQKYDPANTAFEKHTLRFCSRCTDVVIKTFDSIVDHFKLNDPAKPRVKKEYVCFLPAKEDTGKKRDSDLNPKIHLCQNTKLGRIPYLIKDGLENILETQKIKSVLIIGEGRTCKSILSDVAEKLRDFGFRYVDHKASEKKVFSFKQYIIEGYKLLSRGGNDLLAWRLLCLGLKERDRQKLIAEHYADASGFLSAIPRTFRKRHQRNAEVLDRILSKPQSERKKIADSSITRLLDELVERRSKERETFMSQLISENKNLARPLNSLDITVTNILGAKGLSADVVFLVGFDQGKLPQGNEVQESEIYQMLVALTRPKKRIYLINTVGCEMSYFKKCIKDEFLETI